MLCEKCGAQNEMGAQFCGVCGQELPANSGGNGFADILVYGRKEPTSRQSETSGASKRIEKEIESLTRAQRKTIHAQRLIIGLTVIVCVVSIIGIFFPRMDTESVSSHVLSQIRNELNGQVNSWEAQIGDMLSEADDKIATIDGKMDEVDDKISIVDDRIDIVDDKITDLQEMTQPVVDTSNEPDESVYGANSVAREADDAAPITTRPMNEEQISPSEGDSDRSVDGTHSDSD